MMTDDKLTQDLFYADLDRDRIEWIYYSADFESGDRFVKAVFDRDMFMQAFESVEDKRNIFRYLEERCVQVLSVRGSEAFEADWNRVASKEPFAYGCSVDTANDLIQLHLVKEYIDEYCNREFDSNGTYKDLSRIPVGYTTVGNCEIPLQAYANVRDLRVEVYLDDHLAKYYQYDSLWDMANLGMPSLEFDDLTDIPEWIIEKHEKALQDEDLAIRMCLFVKEHDPECYEEIRMEMRTDTAVIRTIKEELHDVELLPGTLDYYGKICSEGMLTDAEEEKTLHIMTELYHRYSDAKLEPVGRREVQVLIDVIYALELKEYRIGYDDNGFYLSSGGQHYKGADIYDHLNNSLHSDQLRKLRESDFGTYTDLKDLASKYGVGIDVKNKPVHERRMAR